MTPRLAALGLTLLLGGCKEEPATTNPQPPPLVKRLEGSRPFACSRQPIEGVDCILCTDSGAGRLTTAPVSISCDWDAARKATP